jgi:hypothetical protein
VAYSWEKLGESSNEFDKINPPILGRVGLSPTEVVTDKEFSNLFVKDKDGKYWRLCLEDYDGKMIEIIGLSADIARQISYY